jgi:hypothetical protein
MLLAALPATADAPLDAAAIGDKIRAAAGPVADAYREIDDTQFSNGARTIEHDYHRGKDYWTGYRIISKGAYESDEGDGTIGGAFFRLFTVSLNYANSRVDLVPNRAGRAAMGIK